MTVWWFADSDTGVHFGPFLTMQEADRILAAMPLIARWHMTLSWEAPANIAPQASIRAVSGSPC